jgi:hypothetical protein
MSSLLQKGKTELTGVCDKAARGRKVKVLQRAIRAMGPTITMTTMNLRQSTKVSMKVRAVKAIRNETTPSQWRRRRLMRSSSRR